ncbi:CAP domain-containing protein [Erythrobacter sp. JK5]|uniref:CAP domain-containing protein n=1 Tax=Erythrobacter sp. JK5 TaxID=2829500 RepID=UPI001BA54133|nr:CAP domain-containing protein [Erythrobacter sp. JK5]QUL38723.1 SCP-like extracellular [Erythrobacter sp. JK5]
MGFRADSLALAAGIAALAASVAAAQSPTPKPETIWLDAHNAERAEFGSEPLRWNDALADEARRWAVRLAREGRMRHAPIAARNGSGENLWMGTRGYFRPEQMIASFASEKRHFRAGTFPQVSTTGNWADVGHYTQIVWRDTRDVGCAMAQGRDFDVLVCRYWPAGNATGAQVAPRPRVANR